MIHAHRFHSHFARTLDMILDFLSHKYLWLFRLSIDKREFSIKVSHHVVKCLVHGISNSDLRFENSSPITYCGRGTTWRFFFFFKITGQGQQEGKREWGNFILLLFSMLQHVTVFAMRTFYRKYSFQAPHCFQIGMLHFDFPTGILMQSN